MMAASGMYVSEYLLFTAGLVQTLGEQGRSPFISFLLSFHFISFFSSLFFFNNLHRSRLNLLSIAIKNELKECFLLF